MTELGARTSKVDPAVFYWTDGNGSLKGVLACHVDDFIWGGTEQFEAQVIQKMRAKLNVGKEESIAFRYIGIELQHQNDSILL